jgi:hypothetical protein
MNIAMRYRDRVEPSMMMPKVNWRQARNDRHGQPVPSTQAVGTDLEVLQANSPKRNGDRRSAAQSKREVAYSKT